jgi:predicted Zn-dependent peptidase
MVLSRASVVIGGDLELSEAKELAKEVLSVLEVGKDEKLKTFAPTSDIKREDIYKDTKQAYIYFGSPYNMKVNDNDVYKAKVATFILGSGGFGSRMMEEIRVKKGLAYSAYCQIHINKSRSSFGGHLQTKLETQEEAIEIVKKVISDFVKGGVTEDELEQAKKFIIGSEPLRNERLSQRLHRAHDEYYKGFKIGHTKEQLKMIESLSLKDLNSFISSHDEINKLSFCVVTKKDDSKK